MRMKNKVLSRYRLRFNKVCIWNCWFPTNSLLLWDVLMKDLKQYFSKKNMSITRCVFLILEISLKRLVYSLWIYIKKEVFTSFAKSQDLIMSNYCSLNEKRISRSLKWERIILNQRKWYQRNFLGSLFLNSCS